MKFPQDKYIFVDEINVLTALNKCNAVKHTIGNDSMCVRAFLFKSVW